MRLSELDRGLYSLGTSVGEVPTYIIGVGRIVSSSPTYENDLLSRWLVYASMQDSHAYGNPAFWFGHPGSLRRILEPSSGQERQLAQEPIYTDRTIFRRVHVMGHAVSVDCTGTSRYRSPGQDEEGLILLHPSDF